MICPRCKGLVLGDTFLNESCYWMHGLRCINCGWIKWLSMEKVGNNDNKTKNRRNDKYSELELYRDRSGRAKYSSSYVQCK